MFAIIDITALTSILVLILLEGLLSLDNALALAVTVRHLPPQERRRALTWGIWGAVIFRAIALLFLTHLLAFNWIKFLGGGYLIWLSVQHWLKDSEESNPIHSPLGVSFWRTVIAVELMDIAFSVDSILAAVAVSNRYWIIFTGGVVGIIMMRFAAVLFIRLIEWFPRLEQTAYLLVATIGTKLVIQGFDLPGVDFHQTGSLASTAFWLAVVISIAVGFTGPTKKRITA